MGQLSCVCKLNILFKNSLEVEHRCLQHRFLSLVPVHRDDLQLVATACMFIASKFEEIHPPPLEKLSEVTVGQYSPEEIINAESYILSVLDFRIAVPTAKVR